MKKLGDYLVTKHFGVGMMHGFGTFASKEGAKYFAESRSHSKGRFRAKAVVRIWKLVQEIEVSNER